jgi:hypothetical protein
MDKCNYISQMNLLEFIYYLLCTVQLCWMNILMFEINYYNITSSLFSFITIDE